MVRSIRHGATRVREHLAVAQYFEEQDIKIIFTDLTHALVLHQPKNSLRFMYEEIGRKIKELDQKSELDAAVVDKQMRRASDKACLVRVHAEYEGPDGRRKITFSRLLPLQEKMQRYHAEQEAVKAVHDVIWDPADEQPLRQKAAVAAERATDCDVNMQGHEYESSPTVNDPSANAPSEVAMLLKSMELESVLAVFFPGRTLEDFLALQRCDVVSSVGNAKEALVDTIMDVIDKANAAHEVQAAGGNKYTAVLEGRPVEAFFDGVTGIAGEPHPDIERGMAEEHLLKPDCNVRFTTTNYGVTTTPAIEYMVTLKAMGISIPASKALQLFMESGWKDSESAWIKPDQVKPDHVTQEKRLSMTQTRRCRQKGGGAPLADLRVLRPIEYYGEFREDGRLKSFELNYSADTPMQKRVKEAKLTRMDIVAIVLSSGPCYMLYNGLLRGFGDCGEVPDYVEFGSDEFWQHLKKVAVSSRMKEAGHRYSSTLHALASAVKKLQLTAEDGQGTRLYRGLSGLDVREFLSGQGFCETAFMSTTRSLNVALNYSGIKDGKVATVLAFELSKIDHGADISDFSQYPSERETVFNTCSYLEYVRGRDEIHVTEYGLVRVLLVKVNANSKALTIEELQGRRKTVVVSMLDTIYADVCHDLETRVQTEQFRARLAQEEEMHIRDYKDAFVQSIKDESAERVKVYKEKESTWFASNARLAKVIVDGLDIATLAHAKFTLWLRDHTLTLYNMGDRSDPFIYFDFQRAYAKFLARQREDLTKAAEAAARQGSDGDAAERLQTLALEDCAVRRWIAGEDTEELEHADEITSATPLWTYSFRGDVEVAERLLQARADIEAVPSKDEEGKTSLVCAAKEGNADMVLLLLKYKANVEATDTDKGTPLNLAAVGGHAQIVEALLQAKANVSAQDAYKRTALHWAAYRGHAESVVGGRRREAGGGGLVVMETLLQAKADVGAEDEDNSTALHLAAEGGHSESVEVLVQAKADVGAQDKDKWTPLHYAANGGHPEAVEAVMHYASHKGHTESVEALVQAKADVCAQNKDGHTPLDLAEMRGREDAAAVLRKHATMSSREPR